VDKSRNVNNLPPENTLELVGTAAGISGNPLLASTSEFLKKRLKM